MELLVILLGLIKYFSIGAVIVLLLIDNDLISKETSKAMLWVYSFLLGTFGSLLLLYSGLFTNLLPVATLLTWCLGLAAALYLFLKRRKSFNENFGILNWEGIVFLVGFIIQSINLSLQPVMANDARGIWLLKAKALFTGTNTFISYLQNPAFVYSHTDYPISMPLLYVDLLRPLGTFWEPAVGILSFAFFFFLVVAIYGTIKHFTKVKPILALAIVAVIFFTQEYARQGWSGLSDVPLSLAFLGTVSALYFASKPPIGIVNYLPAIIFAGYSSTIKNEGQTFLALTVLLVAWIVVSKFFKQIFKPTTLLFIVPLLPILLWKLLMSHYAIDNDILSSPNLADIIKRVPILITEISPRLFDGLRFGIFFTPALIISLLPIRKQTDKVLSSIGLIILGQAAVYLVIYLITPHDLVWHISTSFSRLLLHLLPGIYFLALTRLQDKIPYNQQ